ncbi:MAG: metallophosphoesterase [Microcoleaceae cyanobacterium]
MSDKLKSISIAIVCGTALLAVWSFIEPFVINTEVETANIPNLPPAWDGQQVAQITDFQIGLWGDNRSTARRSVAKIIEAKPAAALISGDFLYHPGQNIEPEVEAAVEIVRPLVEAGIPTYAVLGNHDYGMSSRSAAPETENAQRIETALEAAGIEVLENESVQLRLPESNELIYLVGVGSLWAKRDNVELALSTVPSDSPRIAMMHNPDTFEQFPANSAPLAVAGHTHGGQVRVPGLPQWSWLQFTQKDKVYADGWAKGYGEAGNQLYVNPGIGMSYAPIRLFCPPELTFFTLRAD